MPFLNMARSAWYARQASHCAKGSALGSSSRRTSHPMRFSVSLPTCMPDSRHKRLRKSSRLLSSGGISSISTYEPTSGSADRHGHSFGAYAPTRQSDGSRSYVFGDTSSPDLLACHSLRDSPRPLRQEGNGATGRF